MFFLLELISLLLFNFFFFKSRIFYITYSCCTRRTVIIFYSHYICIHIAHFHFTTSSTNDLQVRLVAGPLPIPLPRDYSGLMQLENATRGPIVLGCAVPLLPERPLPNTTVPELLELVATGPTAPRVKRARLGCPSEARLLASPKMQRLLSACR